MKLLRRISRYYLLLSAVVFLVTGGLLYGLLHQILNHHFDETLLAIRADLTRQLAQLDSLPERMVMLDEIIEIRPVLAATGGVTFVDTLCPVFDPEEKEFELEPYRKLSFPTTLHDRAYRISVSRSKVESGDLVATIFLMIVAALALLILALYTFNHYLAKRLWQPFYATIATMEGFSVTQDRAPTFPTSRTEEFGVLNSSLRRLTQQSLRDYRSLRQFTENASHEMQTPLAILRGQLDLLLRQPDRSSEDYDNLQHLSEAIARLHKLNRSLLLLAQLDNRQFPDGESLDLAPLLAQKLEQFAPLLNDRQVTVDARIAPCELGIHPVLAEGLLNNLLSNAIRHNQDRGHLSIRLDEKRLRIGNTGQPLEIEPELLFERFRKNSAREPSPGLGLSIVKEICEQYRFGLTYTEREGWHEVTVAFA